MKIAIALLRQLLKKLEHWQTCRALKGLDHQRLKDIGVNHWELTHKRTFNNGRQT